MDSGQTPSEAGDLFNQAHELGIIDERKGVSVWSPYTTM